MKILILVCDAISIIACLVSLYYANKTLRLLSELPVAGTESPSQPPASSVTKET